jgi:hypothetical protein
VAFLGASPRSHRSTPLQIFRQVQFANAIDFAVMRKAEFFQSTTTTITPAINADTVSLDKNKLRRPPLLPMNGLIGI